MIPKVIEAPPSWHQHEDDGVNWFESIKGELERIEKTPIHLLLSNRVYAVTVK